MFVNGGVKLTVVSAPPESQNYVALLAASARLRARRRQLLRADRRAAAEGLAADLR